MRLVWVPDSAAAWWAAPWWALTWLLTCGRQGWLPWCWVEDDRPQPWRVPILQTRDVWQSDGGYRGPANPRPPQANQIPASPPRTGNMGTR